MINKTTKVRTETHIVLETESKLEDPCCEELMKNTEGSLPVILLDDDADKLAICERGWEGDCNWIPIDFCPFCGTKILNKETLVEIALDEQKLAQVILNALRFTKNIDWMTFNKELIGYPTNQEIVSMINILEEHGKLKKTITNDLKIEVTLV